mmetsp:Transcript_14000/g.33018  ORF Transcript_14000/g.33018 Transcript_14000/m.33018 type:complete len:419 (+) Transcript_14000:85-1341(+)
MGGFMGLPHSSHCPCGSAKRSASNLTHTEGEATSKSEPPVADPEAPQAVVPTSLGNGMAEKDKKDKGPQEGQEDVAGEKPGPIGSPENEDEKGDEEASGTRSTCASARREEQDQSDPQQPTDPEPLRVRSSKAGDFIQLATGASSIWEAVEAVRHLDEQKHGMNWALILIGFFALQPFAVAIVKIWLKRSSRVAAPVADTMVSILTEVIQLIVYGYFASWAREAVEIFGLLFGVQVFLLVLMLCCEQSAPNTLPLMDWIDLLQVAFRYYELKFAFYTWFGSLWLMALHHDAPFRQFWYQAGLACISALTELQLGLRLLHMDRIDTELSKDALKQRFDDHPEEFQPSPRTSCAWTLTVLIQAVYSLVFLLAQWSAAWIYMVFDDDKGALEYFVLAWPCFVSLFVPLTCLFYFCCPKELA